MNKLAALLFVFLLCLPLQIWADLGWSQASRAGGIDTHGDSANRIATDSAGNSYIIGYFYVSATFDATTLTSINASRDIFVAKQDPNGNWLWARRAGGEGFDSGSGIFVDGAGNCYITGYYKYNADFGSTVLTNSGTYGCFVAKLDTNGTWLWASQSAGNYVVGENICADASSSVYVIGQYETTATFGATTLLNSGNKDVFTAKLDANGNWLWAVKAGGTSVDFPHGIHLDGNGNIAICGGFMGSCSFGDAILTSSGGYDIFAAKLSTDGAWLWAVKAGGTSNEQANAVRMDSSGNIYLTGYFIGSATFGTTTLTSSGSDDAWVGKLDSAGNWLWATRSGGTGSDSANDLALSAAGDIWITGVYLGTSVYCGHTFVCREYSYDVIAARLDASGNWLSATSCGGPETDYSLGIAPGAGGEMVIAGYFQDTARFGTATLTSAGSSDVFVAKLNSSAAPGIPLTPALVDFELWDDYIYLEWEPVSYDNNGLGISPVFYRIYCQNADPYGTYSLVADNLVDYWWDGMPEAGSTLGFYKVVAVQAED